MRETWKAARVGLMVLLGVGALIAIFRYVDEQSQAGEGYRVYALFDDAQGLIEKSRVVIAGIPVGYIDRIGLEGAKARVDIVINADVELHEDATVAMRAVSLLGEQILAINPGSTREPLMEDGDRLRVASESVGTDDVLHTVNEIAELSAKSMMKAPKDCEGFVAELEGSGSDAAMTECEGRSYLFDRHSTAIRSSPHKLFAHDGLAHRSTVHVGILPRRGASPRAIRGAPAMR